LRLFWEKARKDGCKKPSHKEFFVWNQPICFSASDQMLLRHPTFGKAKGAFRFVYFLESIDQDAPFKFAQDFIP
jgi:hypothetical protein